MKQYKKRTLALVLASAVTVVGAFGAENYKNSLMSLKFNSTAQAVNVTLLTKQDFDNNFNIVKQGAYTYILVLPEVNSEVPQNIELGNGIESVDVKTMPYTNSNKGYTKITIKTIDNVPLYAKTSVFIPSKQETPKQIETRMEQPQQEPIKQEFDTRSRQETTKTSQYNTIHSRSGVDQISPPNMKDSMKQFQPSKVKSTKVTNAITLEELNKQNQENNKKDIWYIIAGVVLVFAIVILLIIKTKEKLIEVTGEQVNYNLDDKPNAKKSKDKNKNKPDKKKSGNLNTTIKNLDKKYSKPVKMPVNNVPTQETEDEQEFVTPEVENVVDLDELLQEKQSSNPEISDDENSALEDFLSGFSFEEEEEIKEEDNRLKEFEEELFNNYMKSDKLEFTQDDVDKIHALMTSEISDDTMKKAPEFLPSSEKNKKPTPLQLLEKFVTVFAVQQNLTFTDKDIDAIYKLMNVELDKDFITDLRTDPDRMKEMQNAIEQQKSKPHKSSELLTLNVKDMLPDLSEALKKQDGKRIESEVKPEVIYASEGYEVSTLKINDNVLPDLSKELDNEDAYKTRPSDAITLVDTSYEVEKMAIKDELPDLKDVMENPEKYETPEPEPEEVDEEALLNNILNVTFKPFDDGTREFEIINDDISVSDMQNEFNQLSDEFEIVNEEDIPPAEENENDDFVTLYDNNYIDFDNNFGNIEEVIPDVEIPIFNDIEELKEIPPEEQKIENIDTGKEEHQAPHQKENENRIIVSEREERIPEFCILENEKYSIVSCSQFRDDMGCYLAKNSKGYCIIGYVGDKIFRIKYYEKLSNEKLQSRISKKLDDGTTRYIVRIGIHKFIMNVKQDDMEFIMDLC